MGKIKKIILIFLIASLSLSYSLISSAFIVRKIRVQGLQRIPASTVLKYLPIKEGENLEPSQTSDLIQALYKTGFFSDVNLGRQGDDLIIQVAERPVIGAIRISGNKEIKTADLMLALKKADIAEGLPYDSSLLEATKRALEQQYNSQGRYAAAVNTSVVNESQNRVSVKIDIVEGKISKIKGIHIVGNKAFSESKLLRQLESSKTKPWSFFTSNDQYVKEKLDADLDKLKVFYMDRGYLKFKVLSSNITMSPDKKKVYVTINIEEGPIYRVSGIELSGELFGKKEAIKKVIALKPGQIFSRKAVLSTRELLEKYLSVQGYALAQVNMQPEVNDANHTVFINFQVSPGKRVYIRRIEFSGNYKTCDEVLRRELRQIEGGLFCSTNIEESKRRLSNLGYLQNVQVRVVPVESNPNLVDLEYVVNETSSATANFQVGYSDARGVLYGANLSQTNFLGTGRSVSAVYQGDKAYNNISFNYFNPYYTMSGIGRGFSVYAQYADPGKIGITPFRMDTYGGTVNYDIPVTEYDHVNFSFGYDRILLYVDRGRDHHSTTSTEVLNFVNQNGDRFDQFKMAVGWSRSTYDRAVFTKCGWKQFLGIQIGLPFTGNSLDYYKISYDGAYYHPIYRDFIFHVRGEVGYGNGYANTSELPFFRNFYAGGIDSVRGYDDNTLGPRDSNFNPIGGNIITIGSASLIFPNPFPDQLRTSLFVDAGNVFHNDIQLGEIRYATGIQFEWISPMGPIHFSFSKALNPGKFDEPKVFQFSLGASF